MVNDIIGVRKALVFWMASSHLDVISTEEAILSIDRSLYGKFKQLDML